MDEVTGTACCVGVSSDGPADGLCRLEDVTCLVRRGKSYPAFDMAFTALPFFWRVAAGCSGGGSCSADSAASSFVRFVFLRPSPCAPFVPFCCSGLGSRAALRLRGGATGVGGRVAVSGGGRSACESEEPAESLAAERVTLGDMRIFVAQVR